MENQFSLKTYQFLCINKAPYRWRSNQLKFSSVLRKHSQITARQIHQSSSLHNIIVGMAFCGLLLTVSLALLIGAFSHASDTAFKIICYDDIGKIDIANDVDIGRCTHVIYYSDAVYNKLDANDLTIHYFGAWDDLNKRITAHKAKGIKVGILLGGWIDSGDSDKYSRLVRNASARAHFVKHSIEFLQQYGFDGLDLWWRHPGCWQDNCSNGHADDKIGYGHLVQELYQAYKPIGLFLSVIVPHDRATLDESYDIAVLANSTNWIGFNVPSGEHHIGRHATGE